MIDLCTLGTGGTMPLHTRALASLYVRNGKQALLVDCGEGTQVEIGRLGWGFQRLDALLISHFHADHCSGVPGFLLALTKAQREAPFHIYGPPGLRRVIEGLRVIAPTLTFPVELHEFSWPGDKGESGNKEECFEAAGLRITAFPLNHGMPCFGFRFELPRPGAFRAEAARTLGIPVRAWSILQRGEPVEDWRPEQVMGPERPGIRFLYATDTRPVPAIARMGEGTQLMILEGMYGEEGDLPKALKNRHMLFREAAQLAREAGTRRLVLTHFSTSLDDPAAFLPEAQRVFPDTVCAADGMTFSLGWPREEGED